MLKRAGMVAGMGVMAGFAGLSLDSRCAAAAASPTLPPGATTDEVNRYMSLTSEEGLTDLAGIHAEYRQAIEMFGENAWRREIIPPTRAECQRPLVDLQEAARVKRCAHCGRA